MNRSTLLLCLWLASSLRAQEWQQLPDFPGTERDDAASFSHYCKVYVGTGIQVGWSLTNDWWRYDVVQGSWIPVASLPATPRQYCTAQSIDGVGYLFGGLDASAPLNELWAYDTSNDSWTARASLPAIGRYACASFVANGKLYIAGGLIAGGGALNELWEYDPIADTWDQRASIPGVPRHRATATTIWQVSEENGLVIGGADAAYVALDEVWRYVPSSDSWIAAAPLPEARFGASSSFDVETPVVMAGTTNNVDFHAGGYAYNPFFDEWALYPEVLPSGRRGGVMGFSHWCSGLYFMYYGTGLDQDLVRHNDWYSTGFAFGIHEGPLARITVSPNPTIERITINGQQAGEPYVVQDALGRTLIYGVTSSIMDLSIAQLAPGRYSFVVLHSIGRSRAPFIKLP